MRKNKGSAVVEITLLIPIILACVVMYINMIFLLLDKSNLADEASTVRYEEDENVSNELRRWQLIADGIHTGGNEEESGN